jgi:integrase/recombinase XerD
VRARSCFNTVRRFCAFLNAEDPRHEVPPTGAFGRGKRPRPAPHLLEPVQIRAIMDATLDLPPKGSISPYTYHYLFGLLAATGLRVSEALALQRDDLTDDGLIVRSGKFGKSRLLPIHATTRRTLTDYMVIRTRKGGDCDDLFVLKTGRVPSKVRVHVVFVQLARRLGLRGPTGTPGPRLHDLRHSFAVRSLEACAHDRQAVAHHMTALSTYLGHADISHTYWYLEATPVLMHDIAAASERLFGERVA